MASTDAFGAVGSQIVSKIFSGVLIFGAVVLVIAILGGLIYYYLIYKKKFDILVKITSERAEEKSKIVWDKAAILTDKKTRGKLLRLFSLRIDLPAPKFNVLQISNKGDYLELYRTSDNVIYYLTPTKIDKAYIIKSDGKNYPMADQSTKMIDPEMDYWSAKRKAQNKGMFDSEKLWMKILPYIPYILGGAFTIFILYILLSHLPNILSQLEALAKTLAEQNRAVITTVS